MIECRYPKSGSGIQPLTSVGFQVTIPILGFPSTVTAQGQSGVELRLAKGLCIKIQNAATFDLACVYKCLCLL